MKKPRCLECGELLMLDEDYTEVSGIRHSEYVCPRCGPKHTLETVSDEEKSDYPYYNM